MAASRADSSWRICRRYRVFFYFCFIALSIQMFLGYSFYTLHQRESKTLVDWKSDTHNQSRLLPNINKSFYLAGKSTVTADRGVLVNNLKRQPIARGVIKPTPSIPPRSNNTESYRKYESTKPRQTVNSLIDELEKRHNCTIISTKETISALTRSKTEACKHGIFDVSCHNEEHHHLYPSQLPRYCPLKGKEPFGKYLGCFRDNKKDRDMAGFNIPFMKDNTPDICVDFCLTGSYLYAGVQYTDECWCGNSYGKHGGLPETSCNAICPGNNSQTCGGFLAQRIFSTGLPAKIANKCEIIYSLDSVRTLTRVRIVFVLTVHGRAVRQVHRLISRLYDPNHYFYIHVDIRSEYMYRELLPLQQKLPNVRLSTERFATIWGGSSLLQAHLTFMRSLLAMSDWHWDYYINLSESDYPIKTVEKLTMFLTKYRGNNFLRSNGRETPTFIKKQGLQFLFYECDNHLWRLGRRDLPKGIRFDGGSDWVGLYREFVEYSVGSSDKLVTGLKEFYRYTLLPVESFFHTLLLNSRFCELWIDSNLHLTNWKRKLGCKCQHKNQVDWCGCSPNVFKTEDIDRLLTYKGKVTFFARKFEPVINLDIINSVDSMMGKDISDLPSLSYNWHNDYHHMDPWNTQSDLWLTFADSFVRRNQQVLGSADSRCIMSNVVILESHVLHVANHFYRYLVKYNSTIPGKQDPVTMESQYSYSQHYKILDPIGPIGRLQTLEIGTDFDPKEQIFRNYPLFLGPESELALRHVWGPGIEATLSVAWIDPIGVVAAFQNITITKEPHIDGHKPKLNTPLRPGVWTLKVLYKRRICAEVQFVVMPYSLHKLVPSTSDEVKSLHNGPRGLYSHTDYSYMKEKLGVKYPEKRINKAVIDGHKVARDLKAWVDVLSSFSWSVQDTCTMADLGHSCPPLDLCKDTRWSSLSPDPKSDVSQIMLSNLKIR